MDIVQITVTKEGKQPYIYAEYKPCCDGKTWVAEITLALPASDTGYVPEIYCTPEEVLGSRVWPSWGVLLKGYRYSSYAITANSLNDAVEMTRRIIRDVQSQLKTIVRRNLKRVAETPPPSKHTFVVGEKSKVTFEIEYSYITARGDYAVQVTLSIPVNELGEIPFSLHSNCWVWGCKIDKTWGKYDPSSNSRFLTHTQFTKTPKAATAYAQQVIQQTLKEIEASAR